MKYTYQFFNSAYGIYIQEFKNGEKQIGRFMSLNTILNKHFKPHRDYKALNNRIKRWIEKEHPEILI